MSVLFRLITIPISNNVPRHMKINIYRQLLLVFFQYACCCTVHSLIITHFLTPWCRVLLEKLTGLQLVKKFPAFHGTRRFITALTSVRQLSLSWASPIPSIYPHPTSWRSILILYTHLRLGLPSGLIPSGFPTKTLYTPSPHPYALHAQPTFLNNYWLNCTNWVCRFWPMENFMISKYFKICPFFSISLSLPK